MEKLEKDGETMDVHNEAMDFLYSSLGKIVPGFTPRKRRLTLVYLDRDRTSKETDAIVWHGSATGDNAMVSALCLEAEKCGWVVTAIYEAGSGGSVRYLYYASWPVDGRGYPPLNVGHKVNHTKPARR